MRNREILRRGRGVGSAGARGGGARIVCLGSMWRPPSLPMINEYASSSDLSIVMISPCAGDAPCLAQETRKRKDLQLALHALACSSRCTFSVQQACCTSRDPLRDEIREVGRRLSLADTQAGRYGRLYSRRRLCARRGSRRTSAPPDPSLTSSKFCDF